MLTLLLPDRATFLSGSYSPVTSLSVSASFPMDMLSDVLLTSIPADKISLTSNTLT